MAKQRQRLDQALVERGLASSRTQAQELIANKAVLVNQAIASKAASRVAPGDTVSLVGPKPKYVARSGGKLEGALIEFGINPSGLACLDVGSSTGGFTDCLLQSGAEHVTCVDVGTNQLHEKISNHPRVSVHEQTDIRKFRTEAQYDLVVVDVSFISVTSISEALAALAKDDGKLVCLVKPQFEVGKKYVSKGNGVISDPELWAFALRRVIAELLQHGFEFRGVTKSSVVGTTGNQEFLIYLER